MIAAVEAFTPQELANTINQGFPLESWLLTSTPWHSVMGEWEIADAWTVGCLGVLSLKVEGGA